MSLNVNLSCALISLELIVLVVAVMVKNLLLADGAVWHGSDVQIFLCPVQFVL